MKRTKRNIGQEIIDGLKEILDVLRKVGPVDGEEFKRELARRMVDARANPAEDLSLEDVKRRLKKKR